MQTAYTDNTKCLKAYASHLFPARASPT